MSTLFQHYKSGLQLGDIGEINGCNSYDKTVKVLVITLLELAQTKGQVYRNFGGEGNMLHTEAEAAS